VIYELINPHDPYTFEAPDAQVAALVCLLLGGGAYGADPESGKEEDTWGVHIFTKGDEVEAEFQERWGMSIDASVRKRKDDLAAALRSFMIAGRAERAGIKAAMEACPTQKARDAFVATYEDKKRSSLTELCSRARSAADRVEKLEPAAASKDDMARLVE
jgi:hypothetical protein